MTSCDNVEKLSVCSQHFEPVSELLSPLDNKFLRACLQWKNISLASGILDAVPRRLESLVEVKLSKAKISDSIKINSQPASLKEQEETQKAHKKNIPRGEVAYICI